MERNMNHFTIYTHNYILDSLDHLVVGKDIENFTAVQKIPIITMLAFMYEAIANHYGEEILKVWKDEVEPKMTPMGKLLLLAEIKGFHIDTSKAPYQSCAQILKLRNLLAHPKTEKIKFTPSSELPEPTWKAKLEQVNLCVAYEDLKCILKSLPKCLGLEVTPDFILGEVK
jgi:hypothetical protein